MKNFIFILILISIFIISACGESVRHLTYTDNELDQIKVSSEGDYKVFTIPNRDWKIRAYLPQYRVAKRDSVIFQATRHYDGEELISVATSIIEPKMEIKDLDGCLEYRKRLMRTKEALIVKEKDRAIITINGDSYKGTTILNFYDGVCIDTSIITSGINKRALENTKRIVDSLQIPAR